MLQYELWVSPHGIAEAWNLHRDIIAIQAKNSRMADRNAILYADVDDLKHGNAAIEERARNELGMVKRGEIFYQVVR